MDKVRDITLYRKDSDQFGTNFEQNEDGSWTCTHGAWTGVLDEETLEMKYPNTDRLIAKYERLVEMDKPIEDNPITQADINKAVEYMGKAHATQEGIKMYVKEKPKATNVDPSKIVKRFIIPLNEAVGENGTVTNHIIGVTTQSRRANKRALKHYLKDYHGIPESQHKRILKAMGFWGDALGTQK